jgi:hypothetical protein
LDVIKNPNKYIISKVRNLKVVQLKRFLKFHFHEIICLQVDKIDIPVFHSLQSTITILPIMQPISSPGAVAKTALSRSSLAQ